MSDAENAELFICSFCEQQLKITRDHVGRRTKCPKCARAIYLFPNRDQVIDTLLSSSWYYERPRLLIGSDRIGPVSDEHFVKLIRAGEIQNDIEIRSPEITNDKWVLAGRVNFSNIQERIDQRYAEQQRRAQKEQRKHEIAARNLDRLSRAVAAAVSDGRVSLNEREQLFNFARSAGIPEAELESLLHSQANRLLENLIEESLEDGILNSDEKQRISDVSVGLGVSLALTSDQSRRLEMCELASHLANGTFVPDNIDVTGVGLNSGETSLARAKVEWCEVVQQKKPVGIALGDGHFLKSVASGDCVLTNTRFVLVSQFTAKKVSLSSIERVHRFRDGIFCNRSTGKSVFLKPAKHGVQWDRFGMLAEYAVSNQPVLGTEPTDAFIPESPVDLDDDLGTSVVTLEWQDPTREPRYTFRVVGDHVGDRAYWIGQINLGEQVQLIREPSNAYDAKAVAVFDGAQHQLGYLKREVAAWFGPMMDRGFGFRSQAYRKPSSGGLIVAVFEY